VDAQPGPSVPPRRGWPRSLVLLGLVLAVAATAVMVAKHTSVAPIPPTPPPNGTGGAPPVGRPAPDFSLPAFTGGALALHNLRGRPVVLNFWASWCAPCREEMPMLVRVHKVYAPRGVEFVGINAEDEAADARRFLDQYHVDYPVVRSVDDRVIDAYAVPGLPTTIFIGADGIVVDKVVGGFTGPAGERLLAARLDRLLARRHR